MDDTLKTPNNCIIEDYFLLKEKIKTFETRTIEMEKRIKELESIVCVYHIEKSNKVGNFVKILEKSHKIYSYYQRLKIILAALLFFFGRQILSHPNFYKLLFKLCSPIR